MKNSTVDVKVRTNDFYVDVNASKLCKKVDVLTDREIGDKHYVYKQLTPASVWTIYHSLNKYPSVTVVDSAGSIVIGEINYVSITEINITFAGAFSGIAYLN